MEHVNDKSSLSGSDHEVMESWTFVDESRSTGGQQQQPETSGSKKEEDEESHPQTTETKTDKYHLSVDQDNDTELSDGISIISDSDCGGRHSPEVLLPPKETQSRSTETSSIPPTPPETPSLTYLSEDKRLAEVDNRLVEREEDLVRGLFGISRRHVVFVVLLAGISGAMFGHIFRLNPGPPCDCTKLIEPLMNRVYDLEVENFKLRDEVTKLTRKILSDMQAPPLNPSQVPPLDPQIQENQVQEEKIWAGDTGEAIVKPLEDESICGADTGDDLFDDYYGKICREAEKRVKDARKAFAENPNWQKTPWKQNTKKDGDKPAVEERKHEKKYDEKKKEKHRKNSDDWKDSDRKNSKEKRKDSREDRKNSKEDRREYKEKDSREDRRNSKEDRRNSKERFDERRKKDDDWSGEDYRKREKYDKMKKGERKDYDDSRERKGGDRKRDRKNEKKWRDDDDDDDDDSKEFDSEWHEKRMNGREQFREKESDEKNGNWYLERGSDREIKRLRTDGSHERRR